MIKNKIDKDLVNQEKYVESFEKLINESLVDQKIKYQIKGRYKSIYSIYNKIKTKNISFEEVYDRFAIRIIYKSIQKNEKLSKNCIKLKIGYIFIKIDLQFSKILYPTN